MVLKMQDYILVLRWNLLKKLSLFFGLILQMSQKTIFFLVVINLEKKKELWRYLKKKDFKTFLKIRYGILGQTMNIPGKSGRKISSLAYTVARRLIGFN